jgi:hypothetical protein
MSAPTLDEFGEPGWNLFDPEVMRKHCTSLGMMTMRGCPFSCNFCSRPYGQKVRRRTPKLVVDELQRAVEQFGVTDFYFHDETFTVNKEHTTDICREIIARGLHSKITWNATMHANTADLETMKLIKRAGCNFLTFGVESGNDKIMAAMKKNITKERVLKAARLPRAEIPFCIISSWPRTRRTDRSTRCASWWLVPSRRSASWCRIRHRDLGPGSQGRRRLQELHLRLGSFGKQGGRPSAESMLTG